MRCALPNLWDPSYENLAPSTFVTDVATPVVDNEQGTRHTIISSSDFLSKMPGEILHAIGGYLSPHDLLNLSLVSSTRHRTVFSQLHEHVEIVGQDGWTSPADIRSLLKAVVLNKDHARRVKSLKLGYLQVADHEFFSDLIVLVYIFGLRSGQAGVEKPEETPESLYKYFIRTGRTPWHIFEAHEILTVYTLMLAFPNVRILQVQASSLSSLQFEGFALHLLNTTARHLHRLTLTLGGPALLNHGLRDMLQRIPDLAEKHLKCEDRPASTRLFIENSPKRTVH